MKKRLKKRAEKARRKKIHELLDIALDINGLSSRKKTLTRNLPTAFFEFSGHVAGVEVCIHKTGWEPGASGNFSVSSYLDGNCNIDYKVKKLKDYAISKGLLK